MQNRTYVSMSPRGLISNFRQYRPKTFSFSVDPDDEFVSDAFQVPTL